jgi:radical SAM superfamily enzyme YgiQ (UPF0313 family)
MITLVNPPNPPGAVSNKDTMGGLGQLYPVGAKHSLPPIDILYAAAELRKRGIPFRIMECLGLMWDVTELILRLDNEKSEFTAIRTSLPTFEWDMKVAQLLRSITSTKVIIFGPYAALYADLTLQLPYVDAVVLGEPEITLAEIGERESFEGCEGVWYKKGGDIIRNPKREPNGTLDKLPFPAWDLVPYHVYDGGELMRNMHPFVTILTSRGCPHGCSYCPYPVAQGRKLRVRSPDNVVDELDWLQGSLGVKSVLFRDPEFAFNRDRVVGICEGILKKRLRLVWRCETRIEDLDEKLISLMARAGCIGINMGVESSNEQVLRGLKRKPIPLEDARRIIRYCKSNDIGSFCFFILGLPGETKESTLKTIRYALKLNPAFLQFTIATPYPGTDLRAWAEQNNFIEDKTQSAMTSYKTTMRNEHMTSDEIQRFQWVAQEAREMEVKRILVRVVGRVLQLGSEIKRWMKYQRERMRLLRTEKDLE